MASQESREIRLTFQKPETMDTRPFPIQRQEWENYALDIPLPNPTIIQSENIADVPCEWVSYGEADNQHILIHLHGGGFVMGSCKTHRHLASYLSKVTGIRVLLIDYRLAPEYPFPSGLGDIVRVYRYLIDSDYQPSQIVMSGDSAGGGLVVSTMLSLRENNIPLPKANILISPWLDLTVSGESIQSRAELDPQLTEEDLRYTATQYTVDKQLANPLVSPVYADLSHLPPTLIQVGDHELLLSDSVTFAEKAKTDGVAVTLDIWDEMWHVWHSSAPDLPEANEALEQIGEYVRTRLISN